MDWAEETITRLRELWSEGHSTAEIGRRLGVSKNAVVGKAHRLDLPPRPSPIRRDGDALGRRPSLRRMDGPTLPPLPCTSKVAQAASPPPAPEAVVPLPAAEADVALPQPVVEPPPAVAESPVVTPEPAPVPKLVVAPPPPPEVVPEVVTIVPPPAVAVQAVAPPSAPAVQVVAPPSAPAPAPRPVSVAPTRLHPVAPARNYGRVVTCCWPIGEPGTRGFRFCDDPSEPGKPYCESHARLAYVKVRDRRDDAA